MIGLLGSLGLMALASLAGGIWMILGLLFIVLSVAYLVFAHGAPPTDDWPRRSVSSACRACRRRSLGG